MATVIISHRVKDYAKWRPVFDSDQSRRENAGIKNIRVFQDQNDSNSIHIIGETDDPLKAAKMMESPELAARMQEGGVITKPAVLVLKKV